MRALRLTAPRTLVEVDIPEPAAPGPGEARVIVRAIGICGTDFSGYLGKMPFIECPRILGHELGVQVAAVGENVTHLKVGDRCSVEPYMNCGLCHPCKLGRTNCCEKLSVLGVHQDGGLCEQLTLPAHKLHPSKTLSFDQLALVETLAIGCHAVQRAAITPEDDVLIIGAGPIGLSVLEFAVLLSENVTVLEVNARRSEFVTANYPGVRVLADCPAEPMAQVIVDATGSPESMTRAVHLARFSGRIIFVGITEETIALDDPLFHRRELSLMASRNALAGDFAHIINLIESHELATRKWVTHSGTFSCVPGKIEEWLKPETGVVKAIVAGPF